MSQIAFIDALTAFFLALSQLGPEPVAKPADPVIKATPPAHAVCSSSVGHSSAGLYPVRVNLTAGPTPIVGNVVFTFVDYQGTNRSRNRFSHEVDISPGEDFRLTHHVGQNTTLGHFEYEAPPPITVNLPDGRTLTCE